MDMTYDERVAAVAAVIKEHVQFTNVDEAREFQKSYLQPESAPVPQQILRMAENFITYASRFGLEPHLRTDTAHRTQVSMVSEAIRACAEREVVLAELTELAELGDIDRTPMLVTAI